MPFTRREFTKQSALTGAGIALTGTVAALATAPGALAAEDSRQGHDDESGHGHSDEPGYGPLVPDPKGILALPAGFSYRIITHSGVTKLDSGEYTLQPRRHGHLRGPARRHPAGQQPRAERHPSTAGSTRSRSPRVWSTTRSPPVAAPSSRPAATATRPSGSASPATSTNCAGGASPWGTWLTCEETEDKAGKNGLLKDHGYVFEVDPYDKRANRDPRPIKAFGRYAHEAVVIDPKSGHAYLTEDAAGPNGLLYRWVPPHGFKHGRGKLRTLADDAGVLQATKCFDSSGQFVDDLSRATKIGTVYGVDWVDVVDRDAKTVSVRKQFGNQDVTRARKLEGMWWGDGGAYIVSSFARAESPVQHDGQVWFYDPKRRTLTLKVLLGVNADPSKDGAFDGPDNITVSPYGGLVIAEDGEGIQHLFGATESGRTYPIARNELNAGTAEKPEYSEFTGVTFSPDGKTLFANIQTPGIMLAITGPWKRQPNRY